MVLNTGNANAAYRDLRTILETSDIALEQKVAARLQRAEWLIASDRRIEPSQSRRDPRVSRNSLSRKASPQAG